jgi:LmbE family N-acetylglucosaminyl deacetylase
MNAQSDQQTSDNRKVLAVFAHPDDAEFMCAGTLALLRNKGWRISMATLTPGDCGTKELSREEISRIRRNEAPKQPSCWEVHTNALGLMTFSDSRGSKSRRIVISDTPRRFARSKILQKSSSLIEFTIRLSRLLHFVKLSIFYLNIHYVSSILCRE